MLLRWGSESIRTSPSESESMIRRAVLGRVSIRCKWAMWCNKSVPPSSSTKKYSKLARSEVKLRDLLGLERSHRFQSTKSMFQTNLLGSWSPPWVLVPYIGLSTQSIAIEILLTSSRLMGLGIYPPGMGIRSALLCVLSLKYSWRSPMKIGDQRWRSRTGTLSKTRVWQECLCYSVFPME